MKSGSKHLELLDHLRGVAILAVLIFHTLGMAFGYDALPWKGWLRDFSGHATFLCFLPVGMIGQAGVAIFFVVSGFCIHLSFETQGREWSRFFIRRFFRIYPPYLLALLLSFLILAINPGLDFRGRDFWTQLLMHGFPSIISIQPRSMASMPPCGAWPWRRSCICFIRSCGG